MGAPFLTVLAITLLCAATVTESILRRSQFQSKNLQQGRATTTTKGFPPLDELCKNVTIFKECYANRILTQVDVVTDYRCKNLEFNQIVTVVNGEDVYSYIKLTPIQMLTTKRPTYWGKIEGAKEPPVNSIAILGFGSNINRVCNDTNCAEQGYNRLHVKSHEWSPCTNLLWLRCAVMGKLYHSPSKSFFLASKYDDSERGVFSQIAKERGLISLQEVCYVNKVCNNAAEMFNVPLDSVTPPCDYNGNTELSFYNQN